ncbi:MAG TPA: glycosyltransferase family 1 protein, partial [Gemmatimonadaceae bacterium]|nr:glycosyltransferase family 1 protein [Gemmatimonadaceae bacterium]
DLAAFAHPDPRWWRAWPRTFRLRSRYRATAKRAAMILCNSAFTAREVHTFLGVPGDRTRVTHFAANDRIAPSLDQMRAALHRLGVRQPYVLTVGATERRKNHAVLLDAMQRVVAERPDASLVMAGPHGALAHHEWLRTLGYVSDADLCALYAGATALVMASTYEGFGIPVLEAMQLGAPVICANAGALPEVAGEAALWFEPHDEEMLAGQIVRVLSDTATRARLTVRGVARAGEFSWKETARLTLAAFDDARTRG